jgi:small subunit ribosomal protein S4
LDRRVPAWLESGAENTEVRVIEVPLRDQIDTGVRESLIVELYSK